MNPEVEAVIQKILKLQNLADPTRGATEHEVATCNQKIKKLLAEHDLSMAHILQKRGEKIPMQELRAEDVGPNGYHKWEQFLHQAVMKICSCDAFYERSFGGQRIVFVGTHADVAIALRMYEYLRKTVISFSRIAKREMGAEFHGNSYRLGLALRMMQRAKEQAQMDTPEEQAAYGALVVVKDQQLKEYMQQKNMRQSRSRGPDVRDSASYRRGRQDGEHADLGTKNRIA